MPIFFRPLIIIILSLSISLGLLYDVTVQAANDRIKLPDIGNSSGILISAALEKKLGQAFIRSIRHQIPISRDQEVNDYIQNLGDKIAKFSEQPNRHFNFFVVNSRQINAFAGPDGYIGINAGLILATESESELASVLAHEIGHITQHHLQRAIETANQMSIPNAAATLAAVVLGLTVPGVGPAAVLAVQAGQVQQQINFTRSHEAEADRVGVQNLADAGLDPRSMPIFFGRLQSATRTYGEKIPEILQTHPAPISRIADTAARAEQYPFKQVLDSQDFRLTRMKLRVYAKRVPSNELIASLENESKQGTKLIKEAARYGLGLALTQDSQFKKAREILQKLTQDAPNQSQYIVAQAVNEYSAKNNQDALALLEKAHKLFPAKRAVNIKYAQISLYAGQAEKALSLLNNDLQHFTPTPQVFDLMSIAYGQIKKPVRGFQYRAEYFYSIGHTKDAIIQLEQALRAANNNFYLSSQIENHLQRLKAELKEPALL